MSDQRDTTKYYIIIFNGSFLFYIKLVLKWNEVKLWLMRTPMNWEFSRIKFCQNRLDR